MKRTLFFTAYLMTYMMLFAQEVKMNFGLSFIVISL